MTRRLEFVIVAIGVLILLALLLGRMGFYNDFIFGDECGPSSVCDQLGPSD